MKSISEPAFTVTDRRRSSPDYVSPEPVPEAPKQSEADPAGSKMIWKSQGLMIVIAQGQQGPVVSGRAVGLRQDGLLAVADYLLLPLWPEKEDWVPKARKRLNSFLGCGCSRVHQCMRHHELIRQWAQEDGARLARMSAQPMPEAVEALFNIERDRQRTNIVVPR